MLCCVFLFCRLITKGTVEENILLKANQKRHLNKLSLEDGGFSSVWNGGSDKKQEPGEALAARDQSSPVREIQLAEFFAGTESSDAEAGDKPQGDNRDIVSNTSTSGAEMAAAMAAVSHRICVYLMQFIGLM